MARKPIHSQMPLPFDRAQLRKPARTVAPVARIAPTLPAGLRELAAAESLTPERVQRLLSVASTVRGKYPVTVAEWRQIDELITKFVDKEQA